jgi:hypothetical protein
MIVLRIAMEHCSRLYRVLPEREGTNVVVWKEEKQGV